MISDLDQTPIYYVYGHYRPNSDIPFYIGKGKKKRAYHKHNRTRHWRNIVNKYGYRVEIMYQDLTEAQAFDLEKEFIKRFGRADLGCGPLVNMTDGGEGSKLSEEAKEHLRKVNLGENNPFFGKKHTPEFVVSRLGNKHGLGNRSRIGQKDSLKTQERKRRAQQNRRNREANKCPQ